MCCNGKKRKEKSQLYVSCLYVRAFTPQRDNLASWKRLLSESLLLSFNEVALFSVWDLKSILLILHRVSTSSEAGRVFRLTDLGLIYVKLPSHRSAVIEKAMSSSKCNLLHRISWISLSVAASSSVTGGSLLSRRAPMRISMSLNLAK